MLFNFNLMYSVVLMKRNTFLLKILCLGLYNLILLLNQDRFYKEYNKKRKKLCCPLYSELYEENLRSWGSPTSFDKW